MMANSVVIKDSSGSHVGVANRRLDVNVLGQLVPKDFDYISLSYTGDDLTSVVYKVGGSGGATVTTLTLSYTNNVLQSVGRS